MDYDKMDDETREFFEVLVKSLYNKFDKKDEIQDFILTISNRIEENDYCDVEMDEDYDTTITDGLQERSDERDDKDNEDLDEEDNEVVVDKEGFYSLK